MNIQIKQNEIEAAVKGYIARKGINLVGKNVTVTFTAGRKDSGLSAELCIEDSEVEEIYQAPVLAVVASFDPVKEELLAEPEVIEPEEPTEPIKTSSLFG